MIFRNAVSADIPSIAAIESLPGYREFVSTWTLAQHHAALAESDTAYILAEEATGSIAGYAILRGLQSEHKSLELKRIAVARPNRGIGRALLAAALATAFDEYGAHRLWLDVFETNIRARRVYESFGFRNDGTFRESILRDGQYHSLVLMSLLDREYRAR